MNKIIGPTRLHVYSLIRDLENLKNKDTTIFALIAILKRECSKLDEEDWNEYTTDTRHFEYTKRDALIDHEKSAYSTKERAILFLLYTYSLDKIDDDFSIIVCSLASALDMKNINPYNYRKYLKLFREPRVVELITITMYDNAIKLFATLISIISQEDLNAGRYDEVEKFLCTYNNLPYSPVFSGYYSVHNVYETLDFIVTYEKMSHLFTAKERRNLEFLKEIELISTPAFESYFRKRIMEIESLSPNSKVTLTKAVCAIIPELLMESRRCLDSLSSFPQTKNP